MLKALDLGLTAILIAIDLSIVFDTISHPILANRLGSSYGVTGPTMSWVRLHMTDPPSLQIKVYSASSHIALCNRGEPQRSVI